MASLSKLHTETRVPDSFTVAETTTPTSLSPSLILLPVSESETESRTRAPEQASRSEVSSDCEDSSDGDVDSDHEDYYAFLREFAGDDPAPPCESEDESEISGGEKDSYAAFLKEKVGSCQASEASECEDKAGAWTPEAASSRPSYGSPDTLSQRDSSSSCETSRRRDIADLSPEPRAIRPQPLDLLLLEATQSPKKVEHQSPISDHCPLLMAPDSPRQSGSIFPQGRRDVPQGPSKRLSLALLTCSIAWTTSGGGLTEDRLKLHCSTFAEQAGAYGGGSRATIFPNTTRKNSCVV